MTKFHRKKLENSEIKLFPRQKCVAAYIEVIPKEGDCTITA